MESEKKHLAQVNRVSDQVKGMIDFVERSAENGVAVHVVEGELWSRILKIGRVRDRE